MPALCDICHARPAVARTTVMQNGERKSISICDYRFRQLMRHQGMSNPFDALLGGSGLSPMFGDVDELLSAEIPRESVDPTDAFSEQTLELLQRAAEKAHALRRNELDTEHLLYVLTDTDVGTALLKELKLSPQDIKGYIDEHAQTGGADPDASIDRMSISPRMKKAIQFAFQALRDLGHSYIGPEHLLIGLAAVPDSIAGTLLKKYGVTPEALRQKVVKVVGKSAEDGRVDTRTGTPNLDKFGRDLTALARQGKLDPVLGRAQEIESTIEVLARRKKNNPVLIGEPGVGKTAQDIALVIGESLVAHLSEVGYQPEFGARELKRQIRQIIETRLAKEMLGDTLKSGDRVEIDYDKDSGDVTFNKLPPATAKEAS